MFTYMYIYIYTNNYYNIYSDIFEIPIRKHTRSAPRGFVPGAPGPILAQHIYTYVCMYVCIYIYIIHSIYTYIYVCVCICVCIYIYIHNIDWHTCPTQVAAQIIFSYPCSETGTKASAPAYDDSGPAWS